MLVKPRKKFRLGILGGILSVFLVAMSAPAASADGGPDYSSIIQNEAAFVASAQFNSTVCPNGGSAFGALAANPWSQGDGNVFVDPYGDNYGAFAMLLAGPSYYTDVFNYIKWYMGEVNYYSSSDTFQGVAGSIFDFTGNPQNCTVTPTGSYDSSDSYAATFLSLVNAFVQADPSEASYFTQSGPAWSLGVIANAISSTQNSNGLTSSRKSSMPNGEYTEDNVEAYRGLEDYETLLDSEGNTYGAQWWENNVTSKILNGINNYEWLSSANAYKDAADQSGASFTPCGSGLIQMFPAGDLLNSGSWRSRVIYRFASSPQGDPNWNDSTPGYPNITCATNNDTESFTAYAAAQAGQYFAANTWLINEQQNWWQSTPPGAPPAHPYPWTVADSGFCAFTAWILWTGQPYIP